MEIKLFGKSLFEVKGNKADFFLTSAQSSLKESKFLPDFLVDNTNVFSNYISIADVQQIQSGKSKPTKKETHLTPKGVFELKLLHNESFKLNTDAAYVDQQLADFKDKLSMIKSEEYDMNRGVKELSSIVIRLENRKKYANVASFFEEFPYTTGSKIDDVVKVHDYLKLGQVAQFMADMPKEAVEVIKNYNVHTNKVCGKQAVFYIIADKKDFEKSNKRRDPILLAQSPFGHFWQILGAWDREMMFLEEL